MKPFYNIQQMVPCVILSMVFFSGLGLKQSYCNCDWKNKQDEKKKGHIIGGARADYGEYPFMAGLFEEADDSMDSVQCGATIIGSYQLLTAAHCVNPLSNYSVITGVLGLLDSDFMNIRKVSKIDIHPDFDEDTLDGDIALLTVDRPLEMGFNRITPVCFNSKNRKKKNSKFRIVGWGYISNMSTPEYLQEVTVEEHDYYDCYNRGLVDKYDGKQFCTLSKDKGPCLGDSGGPLLLFDAINKIYTLEGIVSKGPEDCRTLPSVHIDIHHPKYMEWIREKSKDPICWSKSLIEETRYGGE